MIDTIAKRLAIPSPVVLATVFKVVGSTPQVTGAKALIEPDGAIHGTLGGGMLEAEAQRRAGEVCSNGLLTSFAFAMDATYAREAGPICGGTMWIMLDPRRELLLSAYQSAYDDLRANRPGVLVTRMEQDIAPQWIAADKLDLPNLDIATRDLHAALDTESPLYIEGPPAIFIEPVVPAPRLLIVGGGHVGQAVAHQAHVVGFAVTVVDDRPEFTQPDRFPLGVATHHGILYDTVRGFAIDRATYVVLVSKGHRPDAEALEACIDSPAAYIGMIGSRRKILELKTDFLARGIATETTWARLYAPIGLDLGAVTVPEIATSIVAQLVAVRRKRDGARAEAMSLQ